MIYETNSAEETLALGMQLAKDISPGTLITLSGDLGVGKTVFAKGFARGLGITEPVTSPTFTIVCEYDSGDIPLYHFDVYRIADPQEMYEIGFEDYFYGDGVCLVEWAELIEELLPARRTEVMIERDADGDFDHRRIRVETIG